MNEIIVTTIHQKKVNGKWVDDPNISIKTNKMDIEYYYNIYYKSALLFCKSINFKQRTTCNEYGLVTKLTSISPTKDKRAVYLFDLKDNINQNQLVKTLWEMNYKRRYSYDEE